jgi:hypothetical protein
MPSASMGLVLQRRIVRDVVAVWMAGEQLGDKMRTRPIGSSLPGRPCASDWALAGS